MKLNWLLDIYQSGAFVLAFSLAYLLEQTRWYTLSHYIDPLGLLILIIMIIPEPLKIIKTSIIELLDGTEDYTKYDEKTKKIKNIINQYNAEILIEKIICRSAGRKIFIYVILNQDSIFEQKHIEELRPLLQHVSNQSNGPIELIIGFSIEINRVTK